MRDPQGEFRKRFLARRGFYSPGAQNNIKMTEQDRHKNRLQSKNRNRLSRKPKRVGDKPKGTKEQKLRGNEARMNDRWRNQVISKHY